MEALSDTLRAQIAASANAQTPYEDLELDFQRTVSAALYRHALQLHSFRERARYDPEFHGVATVGPLEEEEYYTRMIDHLRTSLSLYPHQLADVFAGRLRITPFDYYSSMLVEVIRNENAYDSLPNWTAADCKRVIGVGRNEFINIMNVYRSKGWLAKQRRRTTAALLPQVPCVAEIQPDWRVCCVAVREEELLLLEDGVVEAVQRLQGRPKQSAMVAELGLRCSQRLYQQGLVWLDVPVTLQDRIKILPLHNFVMNKDCTGEDRFEMLLYELLISHDQRSTVEQLAQVLGAPRDMVRRAIGLYLRLGFASKIDTAEEAVPEEDEDGPKDKRIGLLFDSQLPGALMMGNLSNALKAHAVTLFEAGKLADESMEPFLRELSDLPSEPEHADPDDTSYLYACALREALGTLRHNPEWTVEGSDGGVDILRIDSLHALGELRKGRVLAHHYTILMSLSPLDSKVRPVAAPAPVLHFGPVSEAMHSPWLKLWVFGVCGIGPSTLVFPRGTVLRTLPAVLHDAPSCVLHPWGAEPTTVPKQLLLMHLNEALIGTPVLVHTLQDHSSVDLALPLTEQAQHDAGVDCLLQTVCAKLDISLILGHMKVAKVCDRWVPLDLVLGCLCTAVSYTHLRAHETVLDLVCRLLLEKKKNNT
eukprot:TRINITY_DN19704_c0_g1_i2.p1 TRINITY_DN19704_c0_g1~~TRINITY_DN19704_c0_g1_i2.p1  ORF type:complete len:648 (-),score=142.64 TRINITY_DN19704_c0_g1_i2:12-1955(-)